MTMIITFSAVLLLMKFLLWLYNRTEAGQFHSFIADGRRAGLTVEQTLDELSLREAYVRLRRANSEECIRRGGHLPPWLLHERALDAAKEVGDYHGKEMGKRFATWVGTMSERELLLPGAFDLTVETARRRIQQTNIGDRLPPHMMRDFRNAMRTERGR
jgi:hypothetical protein